MLPVNGATYNLSWNNHLSIVGPISQLQMPQDQAQVSFFPAYSRLLRMPLQRASSPRPTEPTEPS